MTEVDDVVEGDSIYRDEIPLDLNKIKKHEVIPTGLELHLTDWGNEISASLSLEGFSARAYIIKKWKDKEQAEREYKELLEQFKKGNYEIHIYDNGKVDIKFTS